MCEPSVLINSKVSFFFIFEDFSWIQIAALLVYFLSDAWKKPGYLNNIHTFKQYEIRVKRRTMYVVMLPNAPAAAEISNVLF